MPQRILASLKSLVNKRKCLIELQFSLHKCPKPSWQGFRPPPKSSKCPNAPCVNLIGASLKTSCQIHYCKRRINCISHQVHFHFCLHRLVKARNLYTAQQYQDGRRPHLPSAKIQIRQHQQGEDDSEDDSEDEA